MVADIVYVDGQMVKFFLRVPNRFARTFDDLKFKVAHDKINVVNSNSDKAKDGSFSRGG